jgi:hypothetical protein
VRIHPASPFRSDASRATLLAPPIKPRRSGNSFARTENDRNYINIRLPDCQ